MKIFRTTEEPKQMPQWLTTGVTYLLPKSEENKEPKIIDRSPVYQLCIRC